MEKKRILLVDDDAGFTQMLRLNLEAEGYEVAVENDPRMAKAAALSFAPHVILLDVIMPEQEGPDVFSEIHQDDALRHIPIIFLTATVTREETQEERVIGGHPFVAKPADLDGLVKLIEETLVKNIF